MGHDYFSDHEHRKHRESRDDHDERDHRHYMDRDQAPAYSYDYGHGNKLAD
jgi:hypothetical protein